MALYLGSKKVAGNTTSESLDNDVKDYKVTFDDSGEVDGITDMDTFMSSFKSKLQLENLFSIIKDGFKIVKDNIINITNTISNLTASDIKATDTEGILGTENTEVISQDLIDAIADKVVNELVTNTTLTNQLANYVSKSMISTLIENNSSKVSATSLVYQLNNDKASKNSPNLTEPQLTWNLSNNNNVQLRRSGGSDSYEVSFVYTDADGNKTFNGLIGANGEFIASKAPKVHSSTSASAYGQGNSTNYGHVKVSDNYTSSAGSASNGVVASSQAVYNAYNTLNTSKITVGHGQMTSDQRAININFNCNNGTIGLIFSSGPMIIFITVNLKGLTSTLSSVPYYSPYHGTTQISSVNAATGSETNRYRVKINFVDGYIGAYDVAFLTNSVSNVNIQGATG